MAARKKRVHAYHHGDLPRALLDAARIELHKVGLQELSLRSVARRAGVTHTAAYHHFTDKEALLRRLAQEGFEKLDASMVKEAAAAGLDAVARLEATGVGYLRFAADDPEALRLMFDAAHLPDFHKDAPLVEAAGRAFARLVEAVTAARAARRIAGDPMPDALLWWSIVHGFASLARAGRFETAVAAAGNIELGKALLHRAVGAFYPA